MGFKAVLGQYELFTDKNTRDYSAWSIYIEKRDLMHGVCISHRIPRAYRDSKGDVRGRSRHKSNSRVVRNLEKTNMGTKQKNRKQGLTGAKGLTTDFPEGRESPLP